MSTNKSEVVSGGLVMDLPKPVSCTATWVACMRLRAMIVFKDRAE